MLSSTAALVLMSVVGSVEYLVGLFVLYCFWARLVICFFYWREDLGVRRLGGYFMFIFLLISFPVSLSVFYKIFMAFCVYSYYFLPFLL